MFTSTGYAQVHEGLNGRIHGLAFGSKRPRPMVTTLDIHSDCDRNNVSLINILTLLYVRRYACSHTVSFRSIYIRKDHAF